MLLLQIQEAQTVMATAAQPVIPHEEKINLIDMTLKGGWMMIPLFLLLVISIYIFIERFLTIRRANKDQSAFMNSIRDFIMSGRLDAAQALCAGTDAPIARMVSKGVSRIGKPLNDINAAIENVGKLEIAKLEKGLSWLSTTAGAGPMIGFLGTVTGMVEVFFDMAARGNNIEIATLSSGMYQAMITTVGGLVVGIIAFICYNYLVGRIESIVFQLEARTTEFMDLLHEPVK